MNNRLIKTISLASLLHDIPTLLKETSVEQNIFFKGLSYWFQDAFISEFLENSFFRTIKSGNDVNEMRLISEIICEAENLSLGTAVVLPGSLSPVKSFFSCFDTTDIAYSVPDCFFHANELSDDVLLDAKSSKKDILFAPSYQLTAFIDEFSELCRNTPSPRINMVLYLIEKYFWSITLAHHGNDFNYSVFDHAKQTCALAGALYIYLQENHREIFISKNLSIIQDKIHNPTAPYFLCLNLQVSSFESASYEITRYILRIAIHSVLALYELHTPSVFFQSELSAIVLLPNVAVQNIYTVLKKLNARLIDTPVMSAYYITWNTKELRGSDLCQHFSSNRSVVDVIKPEACGLESAFSLYENGILQKNYKKYFGPETCLSSEKNTHPEMNSSHGIQWCPLCSSESKDSLLPISITPDDSRFSLPAAQPGICYFDTPVQTVSELIPLLRQTDCVFSNTFFRTDTHSPKTAKAILKLLLPDPAQCFREYVNLSQLHNYYTITSYFLRYGLMKLIEINDTASCLRCANNELEFAFSPILSLSLFSELFRTINTLMPYQLLPVHLYIYTTESYSNMSAFISLAEHKSTVFVFDSALSFSQFEALCALNSDLNVLFNACTDYEKQDILSYCNRFIHTESYLLKIPDSIYAFTEKLFSCENPLLTARWFYYSIHFIHAEGDQSGEYKNAIQI
ncbi:MAG: hypothetical protein AB1454_10825 [Candidatus Auribacterota bacterium]